MFVILLALLTAAWAVHAYRLESRTASRAGELLLRYLLVGYCGIPMLAVAGLVLIHPHEMAHIIGVEPDHPSTLFLGWAYLGMAAVATLALRFRGSYLVAPTVLWATFFAGATWVHLGPMAGAGGHGHVGVLVIFAAHGLVSLLLVGSAWSAGVWSSPPGGSR